MAAMDDLRAGHDPVAVNQAAVTEIPQQQQSCNARPEDVWERGAMRGTRSRRRPGPNERRHTTFASPARPDPVLPRRIALALTEVVTPASAQIAGGGGNAGLLSQVIHWVATNIIGGLIAAGVLFVGCLLLFGRHTLAGVAVMVIGAIVISQYQTIAGFFGIG